MGSREQALIREFPNGETHLRSLLFRRENGLRRVQGFTPGGSAGRFSAEVLSSLGMGGSAVFGLAEVKRRYLFSESIGE